MKDLFFVGQRSFADAQNDAAKEAMVNFEVEAGAANVLAGVGFEDEKEWQVKIKARKR